MARVRDYVLFPILRVPWKISKLSLPGYFLLHGNTCRSARWGTVARWLSMCRHVEAAMVMRQHVARGLQGYMNTFHLLDLQNKGSLVRVREQTVCTAYADIIHAAHISHNLWARQLYRTACGCARSHLLIPGTSIAPIRNEAGVTPAGGLKGTSRPRALEPPNSRNA
jgi:hypothetical protein